MHETKTRMRLGRGDTVRTLDDAEARMASLRSLKRKQQEIIDNAREAIKPTLHAARLEYELLQARCEVHIQELRHWWYHVRETYKTKSTTLTDGKIGTRLIGGGWNMPSDEDLLATLDMIGRDDLIEVIRKPNKLLIRKQSDKVRLQLGVSRNEGRDEFFVQIEGDPVETFVSMCRLLEL